MLKRPAHPGHRDHVSLQVSSLLLVLLAVLPVCGLAQTQIDTFAVTSAGDTARFWMQLPADYNSANPPPMLIWWHQLGGTQYEMRDYTEFETEANARGWIAASHFGYSDRHWNTKRAQQHCQAMLDWIRERYPFSLDSIYMIGGSMGGAAGQVWHNNNCGEHDYFTAASAGGSQILDTQLRQEQYLAEGDTNRSMRADFGGLPSERDSVAFEYHRASAIHFADTTQSMHFNSLNLPVWSTWGNTDFEWNAYGFPAQWWDSLRMLERASPTQISATEADCHGLQCMWPPGVCDWLSQFSANRYPDTLSINADENDEYYWTRVELTRNDTVFGRYGVVKSPAQHGLDITLVSNIRRLFINAAALNVQPYDTISGLWQNLLSASEHNAEVVLSPIPSILAVTGHNGSPTLWRYDSLDQALTVPLTESGNYRIFVGDTGRVNDIPPIPISPELVGAYPNPFNSLTMLIIASPGGPAEVALYNLLGQLALSLPITLQAGMNHVRLSADHLSSGIYFVSISGSQHKPLKILLLR